MKFDQVNITVIGAFNEQILRNPEWIKRYLFPDSKQKEINLEIKLGFPAGDISSNMEVDGIRIQISTGKLIISIEKHDLESVEALNEFISRLSSSLPHTPITAFGINFEFIEQLKKPVFHTNETILGYVNAEEIHMEQISLSSSKKHSGHIMNYTMQEFMDKNEKFLMKYKFNFHYEANNSKDAPMVKLKNVLLDHAVQENMGKAEEFINRISKIKTVTRKKGMAK